MYRIQQIQHSPATASKLVNVLGKTKRLTVSKNTMADANHLTGLAHSAAGCSFAVNDDIHQNSACDDDVTDNLNSVTIHPNLYDYGCNDEVNDEDFIDEDDVEADSLNHGGQSLLPNLSGASDKVLHNGPNTSHTLSEQDSGLSLFNNPELLACLKSNRAAPSDQSAKDIVVVNDLLSSEPPFGCPLQTTKLIESAMSLISETQKPGPSGDSSLAEEVGKLTYADMNSCDDHWNSITREKCNSGNPLPVSNAYVSGSQSVIDHADSLPTSCKITDQSTVTAKKRHKHTAAKTSSSHKSDSSSNSTGQQRSVDLDEVLRYINGDARDAQKKSSVSKTGKSKTKTKQLSTADCFTSEKGDHSSSDSHGESTDVVLSVTEKPTAASVAPSPSVSTESSVGTGMIDSRCEVGSSAAVCASDITAVEMHPGDGEFTDVVRRKRKDVGGRKKEFRPANFGIFDPSKDSRHSLVVDSTPADSESQGTGRSSVDHSDESQSVVNDDASGQWDPSPAAFPALPSRPARRNSTGNLPAEFVCDSSSLKSTKLVLLHAAGSAYKSSNSHAFTSSYASVVGRNSKNAAENMAAETNGRNGRSISPCSDSVITSHGEPSANISSINIHRPPLVNSTKENMVSPAEVSVPAVVGKTVTDAATSSPAIQPSQLSSTGSVAETMQCITLPAVSANCFETSKLSESSQEPVFTSSRTACHTASTPVPPACDWIESDIPDVSSVHSPDIGVASKPTSCSHGESDSPVFFDTRFKKDFGPSSTNLGISFGYDDLCDAVSDAPVVNCSEESTRGNARQATVINFLQLSTIGSSSPPSVGCSPRGSFDLRAAQRYVQTVYEEVMAMKDAFPGAVHVFGVDFM